MKRTKYLLNTVKETPKEAVVISHQLMLRAGMIKQLASGIYSYLPLALRSLKKIEQIIREEMNASGAIECLMPAIQPSELWKESGRWQIYGKELLRIKDRKENDFCFGPTHEEVVTDIVRREVRSYKELPLNLYQIQTKFRDEVRPRFGLMRGREFIMKDAYSFDVDDEASTESYWVMYEAYKRIFSRCGLEYRPVEADGGLIGGSFTHEFHVLAQSGEDEILSCNNCDYAANVERCEFVLEMNQVENPPAREKVATPGQKTIEEVATFLNIDPQNTVKTLLFTCGDRCLAATLPGHRELNEIALRNVVEGEEIEPMSPDQALNQFGLTIGSIGPVGLPEGLELVLDNSLKQGTWTCGANDDGYHLVGVDASEFKGTFLDLVAAREGDTCARCKKGNFSSHRGIEVGQVFKLGRKYSEKLGATFLDQDGKSQAMVMGCYGIGVGRTMAAALEQNHDKDGIIWPLNIAPFHVNILNLDPNHEQVTQACDALEDALTQQGVEVLVDDRSDRPGFKFKDADLIGIPIHVIVGRKGIESGQVELKIRRSGERVNTALAAAADQIMNQLKLLGW